MTTLTEPILIGQTYLTRDGHRAVVFTGCVDIVGTFWEGQVSDTDWCQWNMDGTHRGGDERLDLVSEAI